jgi:glycosyltransferase involved in cell wall biosynthesis
MPEPQDGPAGSGQAPADFDQPAVSRPDVARIGVIVPTYNRPDLLRSCVLQLAAQSCPPDIICVHQNGHPDSYAWAVADLQTASRIAWLHTPEKIPQHQWYAVPLKFLLECGCTHFFWADHDDLYLRDHIACGLRDLEQFDFSVSSRCGLLFTKGSDFRYAHEVDFTVHAPGGMSSTMCFNRQFAQELLSDITHDAQNYYTDNVVARVTMPKFRCRVSNRRTSIYHAHEGSITSNHWLAKAFA